MPGEDGPPQSVLLRTACDPCSAAKVRCDKKHPTCKRCLQIKIPCSYSESRKHGRNSWRNRLAHERTNKVSTITTITTAPEGRYLQPLSVGTTDGWNLGSQVMVSDNDGLALPSLWSFGDGFGTEMDIDNGSFANWDVDLGNLSPSAAPRPTIPVEEAPSPVPNTSTSTHDCEAQAISILRSLQHGELLPGATSCSTDPIRYAELNLNPHFDRVLATNRAALNGWSKIMTCSCSQCPHLILLYVSILTKMLFWYGIAAKEKISPLEEDAERTHNNPGTSSGRNTTSPSQPPTVDQFTVRPTLIQVGMLNLDVEDQANLHRVLLLRELRKTEEAIDELLAVDRSATEEGKDEFMRSAVQWSLDGISRVRDDLHNMIQRVKSSGVDTKSS